MNHLKKFNESIRSLSSVKDDIKDICLDITDEGYTIDFSKSKKGFEDGAKVWGWCDAFYIYGESLEDFPYINIKEVVDRVIRYLGPDFIDMYILNKSNSANDNNDWIFLDGYDDDEAIGYIRGIKIEFNI